MLEIVSTCPLRGRHSCIRHTPDKARFTESLPQGNRRAALDVLSEIRVKNESVFSRVRAWSQLSAELGQPITTPLCHRAAGGIRNSQRHIQRI